MPASIVRTVNIVDTTPPLPTMLTSRTTNTDSTRAKQGDTIRFFLETDTQPFNTSATILNRTVQAQNFYLTVIIETTILAGDSNGNASFSITAHDSLGNRVTVTEANLTSNQHLYRYSQSRS